MNQGVSGTLSSCAKVGFFGQLCQEQNPIDRIGRFNQCEAMIRKWPQKQFFRSLVDAKLEAGISKQAQADGVGISINTFVTHYSGDREPGKKTIKAMAEYYGVRISDLTDDPLAPIPGMTSEEIEALTPAKRLVMRSVAQKLSPEDVTDEQAEKVWRALDTLISAGTIRPPK